LGDDEMIGPIDDLISGLGLEQAADVGDLLQDEVAIAAVDFFEADVRIKHAQIATFADELFEQRDDFAFAEIVGIFLKAKPSTPRRCAGRSSAF
jgi:hypothetical protein